MLRAPQVSPGARGCSGFFPSFFFFLMEVHPVAAGDAAEEDSAERGTGEFLSQFTRGAAINMQIHRGDGIGSAA